MSDINKKKKKIMSINIQQKTDKNDTMVFVLSSTHLPTLWRQLRNKPQSNEITRKQTVVCLFMNYSKTLRWASLTRPSKAVIKSLKLSS